MKFTVRGAVRAAALVLPAGAALLLTAQTTAPPTMGMVGTSAALANLAPGQYQSVLKAGLNAPGDTPALNYGWSGTPCAAADGVAQVSPNGNAAAGCWNAQFQNGVGVAFYGVSAVAGDAANGAALTAAATAAARLGLPYNLCVPNTGGAEIPTTGSPIFDNMQVNACGATIYKASHLSFGAIFYTLGNPGDTCPGLTRTGSPITTGNGAGSIHIHGLLNLDLAGQDGTALRIDGANATVIDYGPLVTNTGTGSYAYNDCAAIAQPGSYPDAAVTVKGVYGVSNSVYSKINHPMLFQPNWALVGVGATGGTGVWVGTSAGQITSRPNALKIEGGWIKGFSTGVMVFAAGDVRIDGTDTSRNVVAVDCGPAGGSCPGLVYTKAYVESDAVGVLFDVNASGGAVPDMASYSGTGAPCVNNESTVQADPCARSLGVAGQRAVPFTSSSGGSYTFLGRAWQRSFVVEGVGAGGAGGGSQASSATGNASVGAGGGPGEYGRVYCDDPYGINFSRALLSIGAGGAGSAGAAGGAGGNTTLTGFTLATDWAPSTVYTLPPGSSGYLTPTVGNPGGFVFAVSQAGTAGAVEPSSWPQTLGASVTDGGAVLVNIGLGAWSAGMATFVAQPLQGPVIATVIISGGQVFRAILPGTAAGTAPNFAGTSVGQMLIDGTTWWQNIGKVQSITLAAGFGGAAGAAATNANYVAAAAGTNSGSTQTGCTTLAMAPAAPGSYARIAGGGANAVGNSGTGGSTLLGRGGVGSYFNALQQAAGGNGVGYGSGGAGGVSANQASGGATTAGGNGAAGYLSISPFGGGNPW